MLQDVCAFSTVKQVDAAAEEVDKLSGGKQAAAIQAAEAQGAGPSAAAGAATAAAATAVPVGVAGGPAAAAAAGAAPLPPRIGTIEGDKFVLPSSGNKTADKVAAGLLTAGTAVASAVSVLCYCWCWRFVGAAVVSQLFVRWWRPAHAFEMQPSTGAKNEHIAPDITAGGVLGQVVVERASQQPATSSLNAYHLLSDCLPCVLLLSCLAGERSSHSHSRCHSVIRRQADEQRPTQPGARQDLTSIQDRVSCTALCSRVGCGKTCSCQPASCGSQALKVRQLAACG